MTTKIKKSFFVLIFTISGIACQTQKEAETIRYTDFVNPIVGKMCIRDRKEIGKESVKLLMRQINNKGRKTRGKQVVLKAKLVERKSSMK